MLALVSTGANADIVYLTDSGAMGLIRTTGAASADLSGTQYTVSWTDPFLGSYWNGSKTRIILVDRTTDTTESGDTALVFDTSDLAHPIETERKVLSGLYDSQVIASAYNGRSVFFASGTSIHEFRTSDFAPSRSYMYSPKTSDDITAEITGMIVNSNVIYALVQQTNSRDVLLRFDGQLREDVSDSFEKVHLAEDTAAISWLSSSRIAIGYGEGVSVRGNSRFFSQIVSSDAPVKAVCQDSGSGFYFIEQSEAGDTCTTTLKHYESLTDISTLYTNNNGRTCQLVRDSDNGIFAAIAGDKILVYEMNRDILLGEYDSSQLGSLPVQIAASTVKGDDGSTNSGCSAAGTGMLLILAAGCMFLKRYGI